MAKINLSNVSTLSGINSNFQLIEDELNNKVYYRNNPVGEPNTLQTPLDINGQSIFNGLSNFADDAAAAVGGVPVNGLYRTGSVVKIRVS